MNPFRLFLSFCLFALSAVMAFREPLVAGACLLAGSAALVEPSALAGRFLDVTLTPTILLQQTMRQIFVQHPAINYFASEFTRERVKKDQQVIGKIRLRPTVGTYDADEGGYKNGAQDTRDLLVDVPFTMTEHIHVTLKLSHLHALTDSMNKMEEHAQDGGSVLGANIVRYILGHVNSRNFSHATTYTAGNSNKDMLNAVRKRMNQRGVGEPRFGIVNSDVAEALAGDARITNRYDDRSKDTDAGARVRLRNIAGFTEIIEDPALDDLTGTAVAVVGEADDETFTAAAHGFLVNDRVHLTVTTGGTGLETGYYFVKTVPTVNTFTLSETRGGATAAFSADLTEGTVAQAENLSGALFQRNAVAVKTALPNDSVDAARSFGIPVPVETDVLTDAPSGLSMALYKWFEPGTMDAYVTLACLYGATAGFAADASGLAMEPAMELLRTA